MPNSANRPNGELAAAWAGIDHLAEMTRGAERSNHLDRGIDRQRRSAGKVDGLLSALFPKVRRAVGFTFLPIDRWMLKVSRLALQRLC
jgi:hypothetical protein